jgi:1-acyl-sn-glycerol-3-phosphate acyltransferase
VRRYLKKNFHSFRVAKENFPQLAELEESKHLLVIYMNHPSWWDPMIGLFLSQKLFSRRRHYAPIDSLALERYGFFKYLGFFPLQIDHPLTAARQFKEACDSIAAESKSTIWITGEGKFSDPRQRPIHLVSGLHHLGENFRVTFLPLAIEYSFWEERYPEVLVGFGKPIEIEPENRSDKNLQKLLTDRLEITMNQLAQRSMKRQQDDFIILLGGNVGVGGVYDLWRSFKARLSGKKFVREHGKIGI